MTTRRKAAPHNPATQAPRTDVTPPRLPVAWLVVAVFACLAVWVRFRLRATPLERDEGEFAYMGGLILQGVPPYAIAYSMKLPGIYLAYALILAVFGESASGVHLGFAVVHVATIALVFLVGRRLFDDWAGMLAAVAYAVMTLSPSVQGTSAHATHFVVLSALAGLLVLLHALGVGERGDHGDTRGRDGGGLATIAGAGALLGLAFLMKQPGALFAACGVLWVLILGRAPMRVTLVRATLLLLGAAAPVLAAGLWLAASGVMETAWFWVVTYARAYASEIPIRGAGPYFLKTFVPIFESAPVLWLLAGVGVTLPFWGRLSRRPGLALLALTACGAIATSLSFNFRPHYFVLILPGIALLGGAATSELMRTLHRVTGWRAAACMALLPGVLGVVTALGHDREFLFEVTPESASRRLYGSNPFPESEPIANYLERNSGPDDRVAVIGSEPQIYFLSGRRSATGHLYMYGLMEDQPHALAMQQQLIREVEASQPRFVVFVTTPTSWLRQPGSRPDLFRWTTTYLGTGHRLVGCVELPAAGSTEARYYWGPAAAAHRSQAPDRILIFEREEGASPSSDPRRP